MESQPQNPEFSKHPENFQPCQLYYEKRHWCYTQLDQTHKASGTILTDKMVLIRLRIDSS